MSPPAGDEDALEAGASDAGGEDEERQQKEASGGAAAGRLRSLGVVGLLLFTGAEKGSRGCGCLRSRCAKLVVRSHG